MDMVLSKPCSIPKLRALIKMILMAHDLANDSGGTLGSDGLWNAARTEGASGQQQLLRLAMVAVAAGWWLVAELLGTRRPRITGHWLTGSHHCHWPLATGARAQAFLAAIKSARNKLTMREPFLRAAINSARN